MYKITPKVPTVIRSRGKTSIPFYVVKVDLTKDHTVRIGTGNEREEILSGTALDYGIEPVPLPQAKVSIEGIQLRVSERIPVFSFREATPLPDSLDQGDYQVFSAGLRDTPDNNPYYGYLSVRIITPDKSNEVYLIPPESISKVSLSSMQVTTYK